MALTPPDLEALGLPGFGIVRSSLDDPWMAETLQVGTRPVTGERTYEVTLRGGGLLRRYGSSLWRPREPLVETRADGGEWEMSVHSSVVEFDT